MDPPPVPATNGLERTVSTTQSSETSQTAQDFIASQLSLEADAREALPYQFDTCTKPLGPLRQSIYACLTCTPPPTSPYQQFTPAGVCYSCSISCHGEHNLVELFTKRDFECDCGTTRLSNSGTACSLRHNAETGRKGTVTGEKAREANKYNQNFEGKFCGCGDEYDPTTEKGTMFQCLGLGNVEEGGCGEDWWHPECLMGLLRTKELKLAAQTNGALETVKEEAEDATEEHATNGVTASSEAEHAVPLGFPDEDDFDHMICYRCVSAFPWIKQYAGSEGFITAAQSVQTNGADLAGASNSDESSDSRKRKAEEQPEDAVEIKRAKADPAEEEQQQPAASQTNDHSPPPPKHKFLPPPPSGNQVTLFLKEDFRDHLCHCPECFPRLAKHKQLLEEEDVYEPPVSESDGGSEANGHRAPSINSGSLLDRGEAALSSMDRVRAIEGVMAYNHVRDKVKDFLKPFAESGTPVGAEDIKAYFAKLRGDEQAMREAAGGASNNGGSTGTDHRREQGGY